MTLLLTPQGRCTARCYAADYAKCTCVCNGKNHGIGIKRAAEMMWGKKIERVKVPKRKQVVTENQIELLLNA